MEYCYGVAGKRMHTVDERSKKNQEDSGRDIAPKEMKKKKNKRHGEERQLWQNAGTRMEFFFLLAFLSPSPPFS